MSVIFHVSCHKFICIYSKLHLLTIILSIVVKCGSLLLGFRKVWIGCRSDGCLFLLYFDTGINLIDTLLNFFRNRSSGRNVIAGGTETLFVGGVLYAYYLAIGRRIRVFTVLDEHTVWMHIGEILQETLFGGVNVVAGFVPILKCFIKLYFMWQL